MCVSLRNWLCRPSKSSNTHVSFFNNNNNNNNNNNSNNDIVVVVVITVFFIFTGAARILRDEVRNNPNLVPQAEPPRPAGPNPFLFPEQLAIDMPEVGLAQPQAEDRVVDVPYLGNGTGSLRSKAKKRTQLELLLDAAENSVHSGEILGVRLRSNVS